MANSWYDAGLEGFASGNLDWDADNFRIVCIDEADDTPNLTTDEDLADIASGARVAESANLTSKTATDGYLDADDVTLTSVTGDQFESITLFLETGTDGTSTLLLNIDTASGLPLTPNGNDVQIVWDDGPPAAIARL